MTGRLTAARRPRRPRPPILECSARDGRGPCLSSRTRTSVVHNPRWKFTLGPDTYETRDTPRRVEVIKRGARRRSRSRVRRGAKRFPEAHTSRGCIRITTTSRRPLARASRTSVEVYPDLFPGRGGAATSGKMHPLWGGIWCTDAVTPLWKHGRTRWREAPRRRR
jgi:hypothetical protein